MQLVGGHRGTVRKKPKSRAAGVSERKPTKLRVDWFKSFSFPCQPHGSACLHLRIRTFADQDPIRGWVLPWLPVSPSQSAQCVPELVLRFFKCVCCRCEPAILQFAWRQENMDKCA